MPKNEPDPRIAEFVNKLAALDAGDKAKLKRDAGRPIAEAQSIGLFYRLLPYGLRREGDEEKYFIVATLYPLGKSGNVGNFGASLRQVRNDKNKRGLDRRVEILLDADFEQLRFRLRQAVKVLKSNEVAINWQILLEDLLRWNPTSRFVQKEWARAYFALPQPAAEETSTANETKP